MEYGKELSSSGTSVGPPDHDQEEPKFASSSAAWPSTASVDRADHTFLDLFLNDASTNAHTGANSGPSFAASADGYADPSAGAPAAPMAHAADAGAANSGGGGFTEARVNQHPHLEHRTLLSADESGAAADPIPLLPLRPYADFDFPPNWVARQQIGGSGSIDTFVAPIDNVRRREILNAGTTENGNGPGGARATDPSPRLPFHYALPTPPPPRMDATEAEYDAATPSAHSSAAAFRGVLQSGSLTFPAGAGTSTHRPQDPPDEEDLQERQKKRKLGAPPLPNKHGVGDETEEANAEDKIKASRDRNREHARNTRLRKKAYIENLKQSVSELSAHREKVQQEERLRLRHVQQEQNDFFSTLHQLFEYRTTRECDPEKWKELITDDFIMTLPITPYRSFSPSEVAREGGDAGDSGALRVVRGVEGMISDVCSFFVMLQAISRFPSAQGSQLVKASYHHSPEDMVISNNLVMCRWLLMTENAVACGASSELYKSGMLRATFRREGAAAIAAGNGDVVARRGKAKIARLDLLFDVLGFLQLLARTTASSLTANPLSSRASFPVVPNILGLVLSEGEWSGNIKGSPLPHDTPMSPPATSGPATQPRVITQAEPPFRITHVNTAWCTLCGYRPDEAVGQTLAMIQGPMTDTDRLTRMCADVCRKRASSATIVNYRKDGSFFWNYVRVYPLWANGLPTHFLGILENLEVDPSQSESQLHGGHCNPFISEFA